ncbi:MAG: hypothetical protein R2862_00565 [Thermoanaerobaculia bacterium]
MALEGCCDSTAPCSSPSVAVWEERSRRAGAEGRLPRRWCSAPRSGSVEVRRLRRCASTVRPIPSPSAAVSVVGAGLARLEAEVAFGALFARFPGASARTVRRAAARVRCCAVSTGCR